MGHAYDPSADTQTQEPFGLLLAKLNWKAKDAQRDPVFKNTVKRKTYPKPTSSFLQKCASTDRQTETHTLACTQVQLEKHGRAASGRPPPPQLLRLRGPFSTSKPRMRNTLLPNQYHRSCLPVTSALAAAPSTPGQPRGPFLWGHQNLSCKSAFRHTVLTDPQHTRTPPSESFTSAMSLT